MHHEATAASMVDVMWPDDETTEHVYLGRFSGVNWNKNGRLDRASIETHHLRQYLRQDNKKGPRR